MNYKENLKDAFEKLESVQHFEEKSEDFFFNGSKLELAKEKMYVHSQENSSGLLNRVGKKKIFADNKTWKTTIFKRKKPPSPRIKVRTLKNKRDNLKDSIDMIHFDLLFGKKNLNSEYHTTTNRTNSSYILARNIKNMKQRCHSVAERKNTFVTSIDSKITMRNKEKTLRQMRISEDTSQEYCTHPQSLDDSGVFGEGFESTRDYGNSSVNNVNKTPIRSMLQDESGGSRFKNSKSFIQLMTEDPKTTKKPGGRRSETSKFRHPTCANELNPTPMYHKLAAKERKQKLQPLFSSHCGGIWKAIVEEN